MFELYIGAHSPMFVGVEFGEGRRWAGTVHAVAAGEPGPPFKTACGVFVDYFEFAWEWPPEPAERSCPTCVRMTLDPHVGVRARPREVGDRNPPGSPTVRDGSRPPPAAAG